MNQGFSDVAAEFSKQNSTKTPSRMPVKGFFSPPRTRSRRITKTLAQTDSGRKYDVLPPKSRVTDSERPRKRKEQNEDDHVASSDDEMTGVEMEDSKSDSRHISWNAQHASHSLSSRATNFVESSELYTTGTLHRSTPWKSKSSHTQMDNTLATSTVGNWVLNSSQGNPFSSSHQNENVMLSSYGPLSNNDNPTRHENSASTAKYDHPIQVNDSGRPLKTCSNQHEPRKGSKSTNSRALSMTRGAIDYRNRGKEQEHYRKKFYDLLDSDIVYQVEAEGGVTPNGRLFKAGSRMMERVMLERKARESWTNGEITFANYNRLHAENMRLNAEIGLLRERLETIEQIAGGK